MNHRPRRSLSSRPAAGTAASVLTAIVLIAAYGLLLGWGLATVINSFDDGVSAWEGTTLAFLLMTIVQTGGRHTN